METPHLLHSLTWGLRLVPGTFEFSWYLLGFWGKKKKGEGEGKDSKSAHLLPWPFASQLV